jgi:hypothetical protein
LTVQGSRCFRCGRIFYKRGPRKTIESALDRENKQPATEYITKIERSRSRANRKRAADIAIRFEDYARFGRLRAPREVNDLEDGIKEIKAGDVRLPFYEANAADHSDLIRLTHGFHKNSKDCPPPEIRRAIAIRREDQLK